MKKNTLAVVVIVTLLVFMTGCKEQVSHASDKETVYIYAAASLTESFEEIKKEYEILHPEVEIVLNFAGSQILCSQILEGADADMFFSANEKYALKIEESEDIVGKDKVTFATNSLVLIANKECAVIPKDLEGVMALENYSIVLANPEVPVGNYSKKMLEAYLQETNDQSGYDQFYNQVVSYENDVKAVLSKVTMNEADMGIVYRSDALSGDSDQYSFIEIDDSYNQKAAYVSLRFSDSKAATDIYAYITSGKGQEVLADFGLR